MQPPRDVMREENASNYVTCIDQCSILGGFVLLAKLDRPHGCAPNDRVRSDAGRDDAGIRQER